MRDISVFFFNKVFFIRLYKDKLGFPGVSVVKNLPAKAGHMGSTPGPERSPGGGNGNPLQYSCLDNPMDRGDWWASVHGITNSQIQLSN